MTIKELNETEVEETYNRYLVNHFPEDEVKPLSFILRMLREKQYVCLGLFDDRKEPETDPENSGEIFCAYAFIANPASCSMALLDYLAVLPQYRSRGFGSRMLKEISNYLQDGKIPCSGIMIETEHEDFSASEEEKRTRLRRNAFYAGNGVLQSELTASAFGVPYHIWQIPARAGFEADYESLAENYRQIYRYMLDEELYRKFVNVPL